MKSFFVHQTKKVAVLALAIGFMATSCNKSKDAPALPTSTSMDMGKTDLSGTKKTDGYAYGMVALGMTYWNTVIAANIAVPVASFKEAFNHSAVYSNKNKDYVWSYNVVVNNITYTANLHGALDGDNVKWRMLVSQQGGFQDYEWYTGTSKKDGTSGQWKLNKGAAAGVVNYLTIDWTKNGDGTHSTKFTVTDANDVNYGNYVDYSVTNDVEFDGHYNVYKTVGNELTQIMWNFADKHGKVIGSDNVSHCWDSATNDVLCQ